MRDFTVLVVGLVAGMACGVESPLADELQGIAGKPMVLAQAVRRLVSGERVRVQKLARDAESAMQVLNQGGIAPFQDPAYVEKWRASVERYRTALARYPQVDDADVQAARAKLAELDNMVAFGVNEAAKQTAALGDVQARLANVEVHLRDNRSPGWLPAPFDDAEVLRWVAKASAARRTAQQAIAELRRIEPTANLPINQGTVQSGAPYDSNDLKRLMNFANSTIRDVDEAVQTTLNNLKSQFDAQNQELQYYRELDPANDSHRMNAFLQEGAPERIYSELDRQLAFAQSVAAYQRAFGKEPTAGTTERINEIVGLRRTYAENRLQAIGDSRLPEPKSKDAQRLQIAGAILAEPSYGFSEHGPIVLTTPEIVQRQKQVSRAEIKDVDISLSGDVTLSGTETTWNYRWEEFKFATPLKDADSGDWYVWWITAKKFSSGWERTPIGQWVSGAATKGDLIPEANFR